MECFFDVPSTGRVNASADVSPLLFSLFPVVLKIVDGSQPGSLHEFPVLRATDESLVASILVYAVIP